MSVLHDGHTWEVALSFSGEERAAARAVYERLKRAGVRTFFDEDPEAQALLAGENGARILAEVYSARCKLVVVFVSSSYVERSWTRFEAEHLLARLMKERTSPVILLQMQEDICLPELADIRIYVSWRKLGADGIAELVRRKLVSGTSSSGQAPGLAAGTSRAPWWVLVAAVAVLSAGSVYWTLGRDTIRSIDLVELSGGVFRMGSSPEEIQSALEDCLAEAGPEQCLRSLFEREQPIHEVRLSPFRIQRREVTQEQFVAWLESRKDIAVYDGRFVRENNELLLDLYPGHIGIHFTGGHFSVDRIYSTMPVSQVTWYAARSYCRAHGMRLPTEAEWEFAARGKLRRKYPWGDARPACEGSVIRGGVAGICAKIGDGPSSVGGTGFDVTPEGVFDLGGNVAEWVEDSFDARYEGCGEQCNDPVIESSDLAGLRVFRGGYWNGTLVEARGAMRGRQQSDETRFNLGFRCAATGVQS